MVFARDAHVRLDFTDDMPKVADEIREAASDESVGTATNINDALAHSGRNTWKRKSEKKAERRS